MKAETLIPVTFPENDIFFGMDMQFWRGIPHDVVLYPVSCSDIRITFKGDGYGILSHNDEHGLKGSYGNGSIYVQYDDLPEDIKDTCYKLFRNEIEKAKFRKQYDAAVYYFDKLIDEDYEAAKRIYDKLHEVMNDKQKK